MEVKQFKYFLNFLYLIFQYNFAKIICNESKEQKDKLNNRLSEADDAKAKLKDEILRLQNSKVN